MVNALWRGGAEAMTIQGQRVISTTGIKCVGNTVVLHGIPYAPPYGSAPSATGEGCRRRWPTRSTSRSTSSTSTRSGSATANGRRVGPPGLPGFARPAVRHRCSADVPRTAVNLAHPDERSAASRAGTMTRCPRAKILVVDNYDSFVYNLVQYLAQIGAEVEVWRNDDPRFADPTSPTASTASCSRPGPAPRRRPASASTWSSSQAGRLPIFGVCLGLQSIGVAYGGVVDRAPELLHGKTSLVHHDGVGVLAGLPRPFTATRYHSLAIEPDTVPDVLEVTATTPSGVIMAVRHRDLPVEAVQFHPESVLTEGGYQMLANWLAICGDAEAPARAVGLAPLMSGSLSRSLADPSRLAHAARPELDADPRPDRPGGLRDRVLPGALAGAAHHDQVAVAELVPDGRAAAAGPQQERPGRAERDDRDHGVLGLAAADGVAVPGDAVAAVAVEAQPGGAERLAELVGVVRVQRLAGRRRARDPAADRPRRRS